MSSARGTRADLACRSIKVLPRGLCVFLCFFLCGALTLSLTAFLVGGPLSQIQHHQAVEQHDRASDDSDTPSTWLGRWNQRVDKRAVDTDFVWVPPEQLEPPAAKIVWIAESVAPTSEVASTVDRWRVTPVRGPPRPSARVLIG